MTARRNTRRTPSVTTHDAGWIEPAMAELGGAGRMAKDALPGYVGEIDFAIRWAIDWLVSYDAGHCSLLDLLNAAKAGASQVPPPWSRMVLGIVAHKATLTEPAYLGESAPRTPPAVVMSIGSLVQSLLFDEDGTQLRNRDEAVSAAREFLTVRGLLQDIPTHDTIKQWHGEWRDREETDGVTVPRTRSGRPAKK